jgi:hypothetical protein
MRGLPRIDKYWMRAIRMCGCYLRKAPEFQRRKFRTRAL